MSTLGGDLTSNVAAFCRMLRSDLGFHVGHDEAHDALRAVEIVGIGDVGRVRRAMRLVLCAKPEEVKTFDAAFDAFFRHPDRGIRQDRYAPRHTRNAPGAREGQDLRSVEPPPRAPQAHADDHAPAAGDAAIGEMTSAGPEQPSVAAWESLRARYSPIAGSAETPALTLEDSTALLRPASDLVASVRLGRARRWRSQLIGPRLDLRRTLRSSLQTGGESMLIRKLGHPLRNPRFILLVDGSRSMASFGTLMLRFGYALCRRWQRAHVFVFSTSLRDVTRDVRKSMRIREHRLTRLGEAWGGGTRIGESLLAFVRGHGSLLTDDTVVVIYSDGMDVGEVADLERAMRELHRRAAAVLWVNPLADTPGYEPSARGMRAAMPFITELLGVRDASGFAALASAAARAR